MRMDEVEKWVGIKVKTTSSDEKDQAATTRSNTTGKKYIPSNDAMRDTSKQQRDARHKRRERRDTNDKRDETTMRMRRETKQRRERQERRKR